MKSRIQKIIERSDKNWHKTAIKFLKLNEKYLKSTKKIKLNNIKI